LPKFHPGIDVARLLEDPKSWSNGTGIYFLQNVGDTITRSNEFSMAPLSIPKADDLVGLRFSVQGLVFDLVLLAPQGTPGGKAAGTYSPDKLRFVYP
jgi:hypothetical protein